MAERLRFSWNGLTFRPPIEQAKHFTSDRAESDKFTRLHIVLVCLQQRQKVSCIGTLDRVGLGSRF